MLQQQKRKMFNKIVLLAMLLVHQASSEETQEITTEPGNETVPQDLYVIKTIVYEVGILTDAGNDTEASQNQTHEQVDVSFFDPKHNGSDIDLSHIPLPIQTNVSGVSVTGILPANLGSLKAGVNGTFPIFPNQQVKVTHNISTVNPEKSSEFLAGLPHLLGLDKIIINNSTTNSTQE